MTGKKRILDKLKSLQSADLNDIIDHYDLDCNKQFTNKKKVKFIEKKVPNKSLHRYLFGIWYKKPHIIFPLITILIALGFQIYNSFFKDNELKTEIAKNNIEILEVKKMLTSYAIANHDDEEQAKLKILKEYKISEAELIRVAKERERKSSNYIEKAWASIALKDYPKGLEFLKLASYYGNPEAQYNLAMYYADIEKNSELAIKYFEESIDKGNYKGIRNLTHLVKLKESYNFSKLTNLVDKAITQDSTNACLYYAKASIEKDSMQAFKLIQKGEEYGCIQSKYVLALAYHHGYFNTTKNLNLAFNYYKEAAEKGYGPAISDLSQCYRTGTGTNSNPKLEFQWTYKAAQLGHPTDQGNLAILYYKGRGTTQNLLKSEYWFRKAAIGKDDRAISILQQNVFPRKNAVVQIQKPTSLTKTTVKQFYDENFKQSLNAEPIEIKFIAKGSIPLKINPRIDYNLTFSEGESGLNISLNSSNPFQIGVIPLHNLEDVESELYAEFNYKLSEFINNAELSKI